MKQFLIYIIYWFSIMNDYAKLFGEIIIIERERERRECRLLKKKQKKMKREMNDDGIYFPEIN